jgi:hypothetical protein
MTVLAQRRVVIGAKQFGNRMDWNNMGIFAVNAMDALGLDILGADRGWAGMAVSRESSNSVRVTLGRAWKDGKFYANVEDDSIVVSLATVAPTLAELIVAIVVTGAETLDGEEQRTFKTSGPGEPLAKTPEPWKTEVRRALTVGYIPGSDAVTPQPPFIEPNYIPVAYVRMTTTGIPETGAITMLTDFQLPTQQGMQARLLSLEAFRQTIGSRVETLAGDLAAIGSRVDRLNVPAVRQSMSLIAEIADALEFDEGAQLQGFDRFMTEQDSDVDNVAYKARVYEGIRAPWAASKEVIPQLLNPTDPKVVTKSGWMMPVHTEERRLDIWGQYISVNISNFQYANNSFNVYPGAKRRRRYGPSQVHAANSAFWQKAAYAVDYLSETFMIDGETYNITDQWIEDGVTYYRVEQYWDDQQKYWNGYQSLVATAANGYTVGQTFLNAQAGWLTSLGLRFGRVDPDKGLKVFVCEAVNGQPDETRVVATGTVAAGGVLLAPPNNPEGVETRVTLTPVFLEAGKRYGTIIVSDGDHAIACRNDNALSNGAFFIGQGGSWTADPGKDMNLRLYFAKFTAPYVMVQLKTETLSGGITDIDAITREMVPDGAESYLMMRIDGNFYRFEKTPGTHPLAAQPQTVELFLVFVGTTEVMPAVKLPDSRINLLRIDDDFLHISEVRNAGGSVTEVELTWLIAGWDAAKHTFPVTITSGANTDTPDATTDYPLSDGTIRRVQSFTLTAPATTYQINAVGTTTDVTDWFVPQKREDLAAA